MQETIELIWIHTVLSDSEWVLLLVSVWNVGILLSRLIVDVYPYFLTLCVQNSWQTRARILLHHRARFHSPYSPLAFGPFTISGGPAT